LGAALGFIIDPTGHAKTKIYANWGRFFEKTLRIGGALAVAESGYLGVTHRTAFRPRLPWFPVLLFSHRRGSDDHQWRNEGSVSRKRLFAGAEHGVQGRHRGQRAVYSRELKRVLKTIFRHQVEQALAGSGQQYVFPNRAWLWNLPQCRHLHVRCELRSEQRLYPGLGELGQRWQAGRLPGCPPRFITLWNLQRKSAFSKGWSLMGNYRLAKLFGNLKACSAMTTAPERSEHHVLVRLRVQPGPGGFSSRLACCRPIAATSSTCGATSVQGNTGTWEWAPSTSGSPSASSWALCLWQRGRTAFGGYAELVLAVRRYKNYVNMHVEYVRPTLAIAQVKVATDMFNLFNRKTVTNIESEIFRTGLACVPNADFLKTARLRAAFYARSRFDWNS